MPDGLDLPQAFPRGWTDTGVTDGGRAYLPVLYRPNSDHLDTCAALAIIKGELGAYDLAERGYQIARPSNLIWVIAKSFVGQGYGQNSR